MDEHSYDTYVIITTMACGTVLLLAGTAFGRGLITLALGVHFGRAV